MVFRSSRQRRAVMAKLRTAKFPEKGRFFLIGSFADKESKVLGVRKLRLTVDRDATPKKLRDIGKQIAKSEPRENLFAVKIEGKRKATAFLSVPPFRPSTIQARRIILRDRRR